MKNSYFVIIAFLCLNCSSDEKAIEVVDEGITYGAVLRTLQFNNTTFAVGDASGVFSVDLEEQDELDGALFDSVDVYAQFLDNTSSNGGTSSTEVLVKSLLADSFTMGPVGLPRTTLEISFAELLNVTNKGLGDVSCKDQFKIRLDIKLNDGRSFTEGDGSSTVIALGSNFSSPYTYIINIIEPIPDDVFTGIYRVENIVEGPFVNTFLTMEDQLVEVKVGHSKNVRFIEAYYIISHIQFEEEKLFEITIACDEVIFANNQFTSREGSCTFQDPPILLGSDVVNGLANPNDDTVFEVQLQEGYLGFDGGCGFNGHVSRVRFSKQ